MKSLSIFTIVLATLLSLNLSSQDLSNGYYNYLLNPYNINPAFAGNERNVSAILNTKTYMAGFSGAPRNTMFGIHSALNNQQGIGARILYDKRGAYELSKYDATYSHQIQLDEKSDLRFGISAGVLRGLLNPSAINNRELLDQTDPTLAGDYYNKTNFLAGFGMLYDYEKLQIGFSVPHLVIGGEELSNFLVGSLSYQHYFKNEDFSITPMLIYQNMPVLDNRYDVLLKGEYQEKVWAQVGYQSTENLNFALGFDFGPFGVGYSYEMNNNDLSNVSSNSNEIVIRLSFLPSKQKHRNELIETLDAYVARFDAMLNDKHDNYSQEAVMSEIKQIRVELSKLEGANDKKTIKEVNKKLTQIEDQINALEAKYGK